jgi:hypothetical protein
MYASLAMIVAIERDGRGGFITYKVLNDVFDDV